VAKSLDSLTAREIEIARRVADGATNREVGQDLAISPKTVEVHLGRIYRKLGLRTRTELAGLMFRGGLMSAVGYFGDLSDWAPALAAVC
jgi:DNA-binding CsgD family transcriptional regulator